MDDSSLSSAGDASSSRSDAERDEGGDESAPGYEPPRLRSLGTLPASTGMPASPFTFPEDPSR